MFLQVEDPVSAGCSVPLVDKLCAVPGQAAGGVASAGFDAVARSMGQAAESVLEEVTTAWTRVPTGGAGTPLAGDGGPVSLLQQDLKVLTTFVAAMALIAAAVRLVMSKRGEEGQVVMYGLLRLLAVSTAGLTFLNLALLAGDSFSVYVLNRSTAGEFGNSEALFESGQLSSGLVFIFGLLAIVTGVIQIGLLLIRSATIVVLAGVWPLAAAASFHPAGEMIWKKVTAWLISFVLFKPAAALCYAAAFRLLNNDGGEPSVLATIEGLLLLILAIVSLPAMLKLFMPTADATGSSGGGGGTGAGVGSAVVATGAVATVATGGAAAKGIVGGIGNQIARGGPGPSGNKG